MGRWSGKACRITTMMALTLSFFLVEIVVGHIANSLALIADSFHMLSDVLALLVGFLSVKYAKRGSSESSTFGWARSEVLGALVNAVFLVALCFMIVVEAMQRLIKRESINDVEQLLYVGAAGLAVNLIGLCLFHNHAHGHTHGGVSHSHSSRTVIASAAELDEEKVKLDADCDDEPSQTSDELSVDEKLNIQAPDIDAGTDYTKLSKVKEGCSKHDKAVTHQLNMRGVFLHVLGDALGSVAVMISAGLTIIVRKYHCPSPGGDIAASQNNHSHEEHHLANWTMDESSGSRCPDPAWVQCVDPILSLLLVVIILSTSIPLLKQTGMILMQMVPPHIDICRIQDRLAEIDGVKGVHELHIWKLAGNKVIASLHVRVESFESYDQVSKLIKEIFHEEGIHSITVQPEFVEHHLQLCNGRVCALECGPDRHCHSDTCCANNGNACDDEASTLSGHSHV